MSEELIGKLSGETAIIGKLSIQNDPEEDHPEIVGKLSIPPFYGERYEGTYEIIPNGNFQLINTMGKFMEEGLLVYPIPYSEVSNLSGGYTANIGG